MTLTRSHLCQKQSVDMANNEMGRYGVVLIGVGSYVHEAGVGMQRRKQISRGGLKTLGDNESC